MGQDYASRHSAKKKRKLLRKEGAVDVDELDGLQDEEEKAGKKRERRKRPKVPPTRLLHKLSESITPLATCVQYVFPVCGMRLQSNQNQMLCFCLALRKIRPRGHH